MKNNPNEHDYQYPEDEMPEQPNPELPEDEGTPKKSGPLQKALAVFKKQWQKNPRLMFIIIAVIVLALFFRFVHKSTVSLNAEKASANAELNTPAPTPAVITPMPQPQAQTDFGLNAPSDSTSTVSNKTVETLKKQLAESDQTVAQLQVTVNTLQDSVNQLTETQQTLNQGLSALASELQGFKTAMAGKKAHKKIIPTAPLVYTLRAVIPGRAWLQGSDGSSPSVTIGDRIPQYGNVLAILPDRGQVATSSGKMIEFSTSDR